MTPRQQKYLMILLIAGTAIQTFVLLTRTIPLGVPGEWVWLRVPAGTVLAFNLSCTLIVLLLYFVFLRWGISIISRCTLIKKNALLVALCLASMTVMWNLKAIPGHIFGHASMSWVTYYPRMSGYFTEAVSGKQSTSQFLANYEQAATEGDYLHQGTHPPGLILYYRFLHNLSQSSPALTRIIIATETLEVTAGLDQLEDQSSAGDHFLTAQQRATLWLSVLTTLFICAASVIPIYFLLARFTSPVIAFAFSGLWPLVPAATLFAPKSDLLLAFFSALLVCLWIDAITSRKLLIAILAGLVLWAAMMTSLAIIVVAVILSLWTILDSARLFLKNKKEKTSFLKSIPLIPLAGIFAGLLLPCLLMWNLFDLNLLSVWLINLSKHAEFYEHNSRTFSLWLLVNPIEMAFSLGMPLFILIIFACYQIIKGRLFSSSSFISSSSFFSSSSLLSLSVVGVWLLLVLSGKNMGEAARLWIFLLPLMLTVAALAWSPTSLEKEKTEAEPFPLSLWTSLFITQALLALVTIATIDPFGFTAV